MSDLMKSSVGEEPRRTPLDRVQEHFAEKDMSCARWKWGVCETRNLIELARRLLTMLEYGIAFQESAFDSEYSCRSDAETSKEAIADASLVSDTERVVESLTKCIHNKLNKIESFVVTGYVANDKEDK